MRCAVRHLIDKRIPFVSLIVAGSVLALTGVLLAAPATPAAVRQTDQVVEVKALLSRDGVRPGEAVKAAILLKVQGGYHINDNAPRDEFLVPTTLTFDEIPGLEVVEIYYPAGRRARYAYSQMELSVYEGEAILGAIIKIGPGTAAGPLKLKGALSYQACDNASCLPPKDLPFEVTVPVVAAGREVLELNAEVFAKIPFSTKLK